MPAVRTGVCVAVSRLGALTVDDERPETAGEDALQLAIEPEDRVGNGHALILHSGSLVECVMRLRRLNIGCFGGGTGLPSLLGGLKHNPWLHLNAVVTMFDSGGSSGQLRDELGVLPPGDILKCALALSRNAREARRVLLARLPTLEHAKLGSHTGGNLLLSMMQRYSGDFLDTIDGLRALLARGASGSAWSRRRSAPSTATARRRAAKSKWTQVRPRGNLFGASGSSRRCPFIPPSRRRSASSTP